ncbi:MAG: hypothetical protein PHU25_01405 [Deltaproteobacteria bacterium]|nr:hypothetical protein [Deltaproteobacteria bacterium]
MTFNAIETIGAAFTLWARALGRLMLIFLVPWAVVLPLGIVTGVLTHMWLSNETYLLPMVAMGTVTILTAMPLFLAMIAGTFLLLADQARHEAGRRGVGEAFGLGFRCFWRFLGATAIAGFAFLGIALLPVLVWFLAWPIAIPLAPVSLLAATFLGVRWAAVGPLIAVDDAGALEALHRSAALVRGRWWRVFTVLLLCLPALALGPLALAVVFAIASGLKDGTR